MAGADLVLAGVAITDGVMHVMVMVMDGAIQDGATAMDGVTQDGVTQDGVITRLITQVIILHIIQAITKDPLTENDMLIILAE